MNFKSYLNRKSTPSRITRKHARQRVFVANAKMAKVARKKRRLERKSLREEQGDE
jgi:hypothetical protein